MNPINLFAVLLAPTILAGCSNDTDSNESQRNAEEIKQAIEEMEQSAKDAIDDMKTEGMMEEAGAAIDARIEEAKNAVDRAGDAAQERVEDTMKQARETADKAEETAMDTAKEIAADAEKKAEETRKAIEEASRDDDGEGES